LGGGGGAMGEIVGQRTPAIQRIWCVVAAL